jgi:hypothetical protein
VRKKISWLIFIFILLLVNACSSGGDEEKEDVGQDGESVVVAITVAPDFSSGAHAVVAADFPYTAQQNLAPTISDLAGDVYAQHLYRLERFQRDNVTKFALRDPAKAIWQYSLRDANDLTSPNPYQLVFASPEKAYVLRYGSSRVWLVNPQATSQNAFKIGELDLSAYADADGSPEPVAGVIVDNKLFILLQRYENFTTLLTPYVVVIDLPTGAEVDTKQDSTGRKGIPLPLKNPNDLQFSQETGRLWVSAVGQYAGFNGEPPVYSGGVLTIEPKSYAVNVVITDQASRGQTTGIAIRNAQQGYLIAYQSFGNNSLYRFNPSSGAFITNPAGEAQPVVGFRGVDIRDLLIDRKSNLWIAFVDGQSPQLALLDAADIVSARVPLALVPNQLLLGTR